MRRLVAALAFCCGLLVGQQAYATVYYLLQNATTTNTIPYGNYGPFSTSANTPLENQVFEVVAVGPSASCTVQIVGSTDGLNWVNYGATINALSSAPAGATGTVPWPYIGANLTSVSGTGAKCTVTLGG